MAQDPSSSAVTANAVGLTDVGRVREHNEDSFLLVDPSSGRALGNGEAISCEIGAAMLLAVADGMGGAAAGEVASRMAVERFKTLLAEVDFGKSSPDQIEVRIEEALQTANADIKQDATDNPERRGMGTTFTAVIATPGRMFIAQIGDSRCYLLRKDTLVRMTRDQSLREQLIEDGTLTEEEAESFGGGNIILQALGVEDSVRPDTKQHELLRGDLLLICSDGLSGMVKDADMEAIVREHEGDLEQGVRRLIEAANEGGGKDNITAILARFDGEGLRAPLGPAGDIEKAGLSWQAPAAPDVPNPMKKVALALVAIIAVILVAYVLSIRTTSNLKVAVKPADLAVEGVLFDQDDNELQRATASGGVVVFGDVDKGDYRVVLSAENHHDKPLTIHVDEAGEIETELQWLRPRGGTVTVTSVVPHVHVVVETRGTGHPDENTDPLENAFGSNVAKPLVFENVAPGSVTVTATRDGFEPLVAELTLEPAGEGAMEVAELSEIVGTLILTTSVEGVEVEVQDRFGEPVASRTLTAGETTLELRSGAEHTLTARKLGYDPFERPLTVPGGGEVRVDLALRPSHVYVVIVSTQSNLRGTIRAVPSGREVGQFRVANGKSDPKRLVPGDYELVIRGNDGTDRAVGFSVRPGQANVQVDADR